MRKYPKDPLLQAINEDIRALEKSLRFDTLQEQFLGKSWQVIKILRDLTLEINRMHQIGEGNRAKPIPGFVQRVQELHDLMGKLRREVETADTGRAETTRLR